MLPRDGRLAAAGLAHAAAGVASVLVAHACNLTQSFDGLTSDPAAPNADGGYDAAADSPTAPPDGGARPSTYAAVVLEDAPLGYWRLGERTGTRLGDASGNGHDAELRGEATRGVPGALAGDEDSALALSEGEIDIGSDAAFAFSARAPFSIEAWIRPATIDARYREIATRVTTSAAGEPETGYQLFSHETKPLGVARYERGACGCVTVASTFTLARDRFVHVVTTYDGDALRLYVDGALAPATGGPSGWTTSPVTAPLVWGSKFVGALDELAIYATALSPERVAAHHRAGVP